MSTNRKKTLAPKDYLEFEEGTILKKIKGDPAIALVYPNTYYLGMSNLGFQSLYALFNQDPRTYCERVFLPDQVVGKQAAQKPLRSLEQSRPVKDFDCVAFSISFENDYLYVPQILDLAEIPFYAKDRGENDPIVIAGGAAITINPEPIRDFCDLLFVGEAEEATQEIVEVLRADLSRDQKISILGKIEGMYVGQEIHFADDKTIPGSICPSNPKPNSLETRVSLHHLRHYKRRVPSDINGFPIETVIHTPYSEFGKLSLIEVQRGCGRGCKFCAEGFIYTPFRQRDYSLIQEQVERGLQARNKIGLIGADLLVYPQILDLMKFIHEKGGTFSPSSIRLDALTPEIVEQLKLSGHRTMAVAPEAGSESLRKQVNKKFDNESVVNAISLLVANGIPNIKMYLMIGLPGETDTHITETLELVKEVRHAMNIEARKSGKVGSLIVSLNPFIPKPRTPYQVGVFEGIKPLEDKIKRFQSNLLPVGGIRMYHENPFFAYVQALLSNGQRQMSDYLMEVFHNQGKLKKSLKRFAFDDQKKKRMSH